MRPLLIYIHGFNSSSQSQKAEEVRHYLLKNQLDIDFLAPTFSNYPGESYQQLQQVVSEQRQSGRDHIALIGSSLGGFMATCASEYMGIKAVLVNPAVHPHQLAHHFLGNHINPHTAQQFTLCEEHIDELRNLEPTSLQYPDRLLVMLQTGDETLDYRAAQTYYTQCQQIVEQGGDHRFQGFDRHLHALLQFLGLGD